MPHQKKEEMKLAMACHSFRAILALNGCERFCVKSMAPTGVQVELRVEYITRWGERLWLETEGATTTREMAWTAGHVWKATVTAPFGKTLRYRYALTRDDATVARRENVWHTLAPSADAAAREAVATDAWDDVSAEASADVRSALMALALAQHPRLGERSPAAGAVDAFVCGDIARFVADDCDVQRWRAGRVTVTAISVPAAHRHVVRMQQPRRDSGWKCDSAPCAGGFVRFHVRVSSPQLSHALCANRGGGEETNR